MNVLNMLLSCFREKMSGDKASHAYWMEQKLTLEHHTQGMLARMSLKQCEQWVPRLEGSRKAATGSSYRRVDPAFLCKFRFKENCRGFTLILITRLFHYFLFSILVTTVTWNEQ